MYYLESVSSGPVSTLKALTPSPPVRRASRLPWIAAVLIVLSGGCASSPLLQRGDPRPQARTVEADRDGERPSRISPEATPERSASLRLTDQGRIALERGETGPAVDHLERAIQIDPANPFAYYHLGLARRDQGRPEEALTLLSQAEVLFRDRPHWVCETLVVMGEIHESRGRRREAAGCYRRALEANPASREAADGLEHTAGP